MPLHKIRTKVRNKFREVNLTRKTAIFTFCEECMGWQPGEVSECTDKYCPLYPFRNEKASKASSTRKGNPKAIAALKKYREERKNKDA
jgi:Zn-finger protein